MNQEGRAKRFALWMVALALFPSLASSQPSAVPDVGPGGVGIFFHRSYRDFDLPGGGVYRADWSRTALAIHGTLAHRIVLRVSGGYEPPHKDSNFPGRIYQTVGVGAGSTVYPFIRGAYRIGASFSWYRWINQDQSPQRYDKVQDGISVALHGERVFKSRALDALVWVGPALLRDRVFEYPTFAPEAKAVSDNNVGALAGGSLVLWKHVSPFVQFAVVEHLQTQAGISYLF